jgi:hypothetical protein
MNPEIKQKWVEALRSGEYKQCRNVLRNDAGEMCCLGVLRELVSPGDTSSTDGRGEFPTQEFLNLVGFDTVHTGGNYRQTANHYSAENDNGASFSEIADAIERNL